MRVITREEAERRASPKPGCYRTVWRYPATVSAKEKLLEQAPRWTDAQATAALRVDEAQAGLAAYLDEEMKLSSAELNTRENRWAEANACEAVREEPW